MSQHAQPSAGPRHQDVTESLHAFIDAVLGGEPSLQAWVVVVRNQTTGEELEHSYQAASPDDAETLAHHDATLRKPTGHFFVQALRVRPRRALWDVRLQGRAQLREALPSGMPLLVGRVVAADEIDARQQALTVYGRGHRGDVSAVEWRFVEPGDLFAVVRS